MPNCQQCVHKETVWFDYPCVECVGDKHFMREKPKEVEKTKFGRNYKIKQRIVEAVESYLECECGAEITHNIADNNFGVWTCNVCKITYVTPYNILPGLVKKE